MQFVTKKKNEEFVWSEKPKINFLYNRNVYDGHANSLEYQYRGTEAF